MLAKLKTALNLIGSGLGFMRPRIGHAADWAERQCATVKHQLPSSDDVEEWTRGNASKLGWGNKPAVASLEHLEELLTDTLSAIQQTSNKRARRIINVAVGKLSGAATIGGIAGLVSSFGAASTGTAIASLSGAAATTAQLYWIGSLAGLGAVAGGFMLAASGVGAGVVAGLWVRTKILGKPRAEKKLQEHEKAILVACITLLNAVKQQIDSGLCVTSSDMRLVARQVLFPLVNQISQHWDSASLKENGIVECQPFDQTLAFLQLRKLNRCRIELDRIATAVLIQPDAR